MPAFVPPPKPAKGKALPTFGRVIGQEEARAQRMQLASLAGLPDPLKQEILRISTQYKGAVNVDALAKGILSLAGTNRALRAEINNLDNFLIILNALPRSAAIYLVEKLALLPVVQDNMLSILQTLPKSGALHLSHILANTSGIKNKEVQEWLKGIKLEGGRELYEAILPHPNLKLIEDMLNNPNIDVHWENIRLDPLFKAINIGNSEVVRLLINAGANVNERNKLGYTPLMQASLNPQIIRLLLEAGANVNAQDNLGYTALTSPSQFGKVDVVKLLIDAGANINTQDSYGRTPLILATEQGYPEVIRILLDAGADPFIRNKVFFGSTALDLARDLARAHLRRNPRFRTNEYNEIIKLLEAAEKAKKEKSARK
jgi:hypothetical protein